MYATNNYASKKALKDDVKRGMKIGVFSPGPFPCNTQNGRVSLEGPRYPKPHRWYASAVVKDGVIVSVS